MPENIIWTKKNVWVRKRYISLHLNFATKTYDKTLRICTVKPNIDEDYIVRGVQGHSYTRNIISPHRLVSLCRCVTVWIWWVELSRVMLWLWSHHTTIPSKQMYSLLFMVDTIWIWPNSIWCFEFMLLIHVKPSYTHTTVLLLFCAIVFLVKLYQLLLSAFALLIKSNRG